MSAAPRPALAEHHLEHAPVVVIWETTQACDLACLHCRASASPRRDTRELTTAEAMELMDTVRRFGHPLFILTGGDPLKRPDTVEMVRYGTAIGLRVAMTPSGTPLMNTATLEALRDAGLARLAVSLDGSTATIHDGFRGVPGSYAWTLRMLQTARDLGMSTQVNTTISRHNADDLDALIDVMGDLGIALWSVFFVVPTGRARREQLITDEETERVLHRLYDLSRVASFDIKTTAALHYRRVVLQRSRIERATRALGAPPVRGGIAGALAGGPGRSRAVSDGNGFVFVSHRGEIYPSGFLPVSAGNVRTHDLVDVYRNHELFRALRDHDRLAGKCGVCEFRHVCGGSRARAYAVTGDYLAEDPACAYVPPAYRRRERVVSPSRGSPYERDHTGTA